MPMKDEAGGGGGISGRESRVLFFEIVAGTRLLSRSRDQAIGLFKSMGDSWGQVMTGMDAETKANLTKMTASFEASMAAIDKRIELTKIKASQLGSGASFGDKLALGSTITQLEAQKAAETTYFNNEKAKLEESGNGWNRFTGAVGTAGRAISGIAIVGAVFGGVLAVLDGVLMSAVKAVSDYATEIVQASEATGLSYQTTQAYLTLVEHFGVSHMIAETMLVRFNKQLQQNSTLLKEFGITSQDPNKALFQFMDAVAHSANSVEVFNKVLGGTVRSGSAQSWIDAALKMAGAADYVAKAQTEVNGTFYKVDTTLRGSEAGFARLEDVMRQTGMLLDDNTVKAGAMSEAISQQLSMAFEGLKMRIGSAVMPTMQALELVFVALIEHIDGAKGATGSLGDMFVNLAKWISNAIGYLVGFIAGIMGVKQADLANIFQKAADSVSALAVGTKGAATNVTSLKDEVKALTEKQKDLGEQTRLQTQALDHQITTLQRNQKAFDDAHDDKVKALENEKTNYEDTLKLQDDLHQSYLVQLQDQLQALQDTQSSRRASGEDLASYEIRLAEQSLSKSIKTEQNKRQTYADTLQQHIDLLKQETDAEKQAYDDQTAARIQALQDQKTALQDALTAQGAAIQKQIDADNTELQGGSNTAIATTEFTASQLADVVNVSLKAMTDSATGSGLAAGSGFIDNMKGSLARAVASALSGLESIGESIGKAIVTGIWNFTKGKGGAIIELGIMESLQGTVQNTLGKIPVIGGALSDFLTSQTTDDMIKQLKAEINAPAMPSPGEAGTGLASILTSLSTATGKYGPGYAEGGIVGGPILSWVGEAGPEAIVPLTNPKRANEVMQQAGIGGHTFNTTFTGPVATGAVASIVMSRMATEAKRQGLVYGAGL